MPSRRRATVKRFIEKLLKLAHFLKYSITFIKLSFILSRPLKSSIIIFIFIFHSICFVTFFFCIELCTLNIEFRLVSCLLLIFFFTFRKSYFMHFFNFQRAFRLFDKLKCSFLLSVPLFIFSKPYETWILFHSFCEITIFLLGIFEIFWR